MDFDNKLKKYKFNNDCLIILAMNPNLPAPFRVIIVEDMPSFRHDVEELLAQQPGFTLIGSCATVHEALVLIKTTKPDLLLLDIRLPDGTGFDILEQMSPVQCKVIILTAYEEYALQAFRYGAIDYLQKPPLNKNEFREALQRVINAQPLLQEQIAITLRSYREDKKQDRLALRSQQSVKIVSFKDICYLQADDCYTIFFLNDGKKIVVSKPLKHYEELLPDKSFLRIHKSYLVNKHYIGRWHPKESLLYLKDGTQLPVSVRKKELVGRFFKFW
jgi:two-component system LytT family response regulator